MTSSHLILCRPLFLLPLISPIIRVFSHESTLCMRCPKYWSYSFSISPSNAHPGLISFRIDWLDLLAHFFFPTLYIYIWMYSFKIYISCLYFLNIGNKVLIIALKSISSNWNIYVILCWFALIRISCCMIYIFLLLIKLGHFLCSYKCS